MGSDSSQLTVANLRVREWQLVVFLQVFFFATALFGLNAPLTTMHFVRQCQTFDVAQHIFRDGWSSVLAPKASFSQQINPFELFSPLPVPSPRFTIIHLEFPFHGLFGWPAALIFPNHDLIVVRLVSVAFAMLSIAIVHLVLRHWLPPYPALAGTALWTTVPLVLYFGQVTTPDILATTGMTLAFLLALRGQIAGSSGAFLFALLAKLSIIVYGLPILVALLIARDCRSLGEFVKISLLWGALPLFGEMVWLSLGLHDPPDSWEVIGGSFSPGDYGHIHLADLRDSSFYLSAALFLFPFGCGIIGITGLCFALANRPRNMNLFLKGSILIAILFNYVFERIVWREPQYSVPVLFWVVLAASFGFPRLIEKYREGKLWRLLLPGLVVAQAAMVCMSLVFLKAPRAPNLRDIEAGAQLTPPDARVVVYAGISCTVPPVWLKRNTVQLYPFAGLDPKILNSFANELQGFQKNGFNYLMVFDTQDHLRSNVLTHSEKLYSSNDTSPTSPIRRFFDDRYKIIFKGDHVILYSLVP